MFRTYQIKWGIFLSITFAAIGFLQKFEHIENHQIRILIENVLRSFGNISICWFIHNYFILHFAKKKNNITKGIISNIIVICILLGLDYLSIEFRSRLSMTDSPNYNNVQDFLINLTKISFISVFIYIVIYNIQINIILQKSKLENEILKQAQLRAQLLSLQQQVSPHFLFNSLSTLKTIAKDQETKTYVIQLSNVYRYLLNFNEHHLASVRNELAFMKSYLYILQERFEEALEISIHVPDEFLHYRIPTLSLQLLIENAVKHNVVSPEKPLRIRIYTNDHPSLIVENSFQPKLSVEESTGKGLQNIKERYQLLADQQVGVCEYNDIFVVTLPLLLG
ncbi:sensor histidine kinase YesM [Pedobacter cryoconitis]|uniref:sensor histidine kinase n=1 Tax=Pedobacter cryoconitis TaxID=188932 RepID=UPI00160C2457|nr:histidine kinase [Pedobacter cryoconitis]MBB6271669.1 sensor histidine kinase YesM [Pedobacter cryoconitis]